MAQRVKTDLEFCMNFIESQVFNTEDELSTFIDSQSSPTSYCFLKFSAHYDTLGAQAWAAGSDIGEVLNLYCSDIPSNIFMVLWTASNHAEEEFYSTLHSLSKFRGEGWNV